MRVNSQLRNAQLEILSQTPNTRIPGRVWYDRNQRKAMLDDGTEATIIGEDTDGISMPFVGGLSLLSDQYGGTQGIPVSARPYDIPLNAPEGGLVSGSVALGDTGTHSEAKLKMDIMARRALTPPNPIESITTEGSLTGVTAEVQRVSLPAPADYVDWKAAINLTAGSFSLATAQAIESIERVGRNHFLITFSSALSEGVELYEGVRDANKVPNFPDGRWGLGGVITGGTNDGKAVVITGKINPYGEPGIIVTTRKDVPNTPDDDVLVPEASTSATFRLYVYRVTVSQNSDLLTDDGGYANGDWVFVKALNTTEQAKFSFSPIYQIGDSVLQGAQILDPLGGDNNPEVGQVARVDGADVWVTSAGNATDSPMLGTIQSIYKEVDIPNYDENLWREDEIELSIGTARVRAALSYQSDNTGSPYVDLFSATNPVIKDIVGGKLIVPGWRGDGLFSGVVAGTFDVVSVGAKITAQSALTGTAVGDGLISTAQKGRVTALDTTDDKVFYLSDFYFARLVARTAPNIVSGLQTAGTTHDLVSTKHKIITANDPTTEVNVGDLIEVGGIGTDKGYSGLLVVGTEAEDSENPGTENSITVDVYDRVKRDSSMDIVAANNAVGVIGSSVHGGQVTARYFFIVKGFEQTVNISDAKYLAHQLTLETGIELSSSDLFSFLFHAIPSGARDMAIVLR